MCAFQYSYDWASRRLAMGNKQIFFDSVTDSKRKTRRYSPVGIRPSLTLHYDGVMGVLS